MKELHFTIIFLISYQIIQAQQIFRMPQKTETRWASAENLKGQKGAGGMANYGRKGSPCISPFTAGMTHILAEYDGGSGTIRKIWLTIQERSPEILRGVRLDFYWDGEAKPAVSVPLGDFFGVGLGKTAAFESAMFSNPEGRSFNCIFPMPFRKGMKLTVTNETDQEIKYLFYEVDYTINDPHGDDMMYFHSYWNRQDSTELRKDFEILPKIEGKGRYLGTNIGVNANMETFFDSWWGEGEVKIYLDGDTENPTLNGTGTEDYIGTGWGQGRYAHLYQGCTYADAKNYEYCFYRLHIPDPVYFYNDIKVTIQQMGLALEKDKEKFAYHETKIYSSGISTEPANIKNKKWTGAIHDRYGDDVSACVYFYLDKPVSNLPSLQSLNERIEDL